MICTVTVTDTVKLAQSLINFYNYNCVLHSWRLIVLFHSLKNRHSTRNTYQRIWLDETEYITHLFLDFCMKYQLTLKTIALFTQLIAQANNGQTWSKINQLDGLASGPTEGLSWRLQSLQLHPSTSTSHPWGGDLTAVTAVHPSTSHWGEVRLQSLDVKLKGGATVTAVRAPLPGCEVEVEGWSCNDCSRTPSPPRCEVEVEGWPSPQNVKGGTVDFEPRFPTHFQPLAS